ncbi:2-keto-4-pentenoate hydratase/2-oxohepta-3-ene-1,7-dioic acid hydratase in catechol pathway [Crenobacter luteus]|uniref:Fumarylacetoacetate hydrolase n=1 Tax=Crenobacter luteus TaxID=1452487 RepID=A0A161SAS8_9NEIS|nr:fumarylacetoacetate hydrolase family protein [Crenobacter luteus]KZE32933.1 fumarylacetoacetate hydrolase [Crenobacter luteus]TCP14771.1 2-keto-4-pentenoate hydratase/2-oxohepta-3-ene-1,7-dioic acid hydratase in catechol pathway [Crenobacter luteus]
MATQLIRFLSNGTPQWGVVFGNKIAPLAGDYPTTADVVRKGRDAARQLTAAQATIDLGSVRVLPPVTANQQFICQGVNYESHVRESGLDPKNFPFNTIFTKAPSCISGPYDDVVRPAHVKLLDYEIELGLVLARDLVPGEVVSDDRLHEVLAGVTIVNDVSARDVQLPQGQFYKGKSYRTFGPTGPVLLLLEPQEWRRWRELNMTLSVNGDVRQRAYCGEMLFKPAQTLTELAAMHDMQAGDLIATGTPAGCAAKAPGKLVMFILKHFMSDAAKWKAFIAKATKNPLYLQPNDVMTLSIRTDDGALDLGQQRTKVVAK